QGGLTSRRKKEIERKKMQRLHIFLHRLKDGVIVRKHMAHRTASFIFLHS
ncbi:unnamed protein product, partial [Choristocarpus tenellus]